MSLNIQELVNEDYLLWLLNSNNLDNRQNKLDSWVNDERFDKKIILAYKNIDIQARGKIPMIKTLLEYSLFTGKLYQYPTISKDPETYIKRKFLYHIDVDLLQEKPQ